jgi:hypothetical protein
MIDDVRRERYFWIGDWGVHDEQENTFRGLMTYAFIRLSVKAFRMLFN